MTNETRPTHILWATHNMNHWELAFKGNLEECEKEMTMEVYAISTDDNGNFFDTKQDAVDYINEHDGFGKNMSINDIYRTSMLMPGYEIHANEIKDSWNNPITGIHYDTYMDGSTDSRPMTSEEITLENS